MSRPFKIGDKVRLKDTFENRRYAADRIRPWSIHQSHTIKDVIRHGAGDTTPVALFSDGAASFSRLEHADAQDAAPPETPRPASPAPMILPTDPAERKNIPITTGVLDYFPRALAEVARVSKAGNDQHNPGQPLHWAKSKSTDHADCIPRHLIDRHTRDTDGQRHSAKLAWRALALLEIELENEEKARALHP